MPQHHNDFSQAATPAYKNAMQSHVRALMLACFGMKLTPTEALDYINNMNLGLSVSYETIRQWYIRFEEGDFELIDHRKTAAA
ncbi:hypothetical protein GGH95_001057 [Coemansia sp. RSA 1836]|nr:hypothetical protein GGH95_001057 [Coemansia sp. RSA 1836]